MNEGFCARMLADEVVAGGDMWMAARESAIRSESSSLCLAIAGALVPSPTSFTFGAAEEQRVISSHGDDRVSRQLWNKGYGRYHYQSDFGGMQFDFPRTILSIHLTPFYDH